MGWNETRETIGVNTYILSKSIGGIYLVVKPLPESSTKVKERLGTEQETGNSFFGDVNQQHRCNH
jgi:hypothetical protein